MSPAESDFRHRYRNDGTIESICCKCFAVVATGQLRADLEKPEGEHICIPSQLERFTPGHMA